MNHRRSCSANSTTSSYDLDPEVDRIMATTDFDVGDTEETLMRKEIAIHVLDPRNVELFLPLFMSLSTMKRAIVLCNEDAFLQFLERARAVLLAQGRSPAIIHRSTVPETPRAVINSPVPLSTPTKKWKYLYVYIFKY